jgi:SAM-dependent methyltransferase
MGSVHINYDPPPETLDYHRVLVSNILALVEHAQELACRSLSVLDVGSGRGELLESLVKSGIFATGLDSDSSCVLRCQEIASAVQGDLNDIEEVFDERSFDLVIASHVLEHLENPTRVVRSIAKVTRQYLIVAVPNLGELNNVIWRRGEPQMVNRGHKCGWDAPHLKTFLAGCGFETVRWQPDRVYLQRRLRPLATALGVTRHLEDCMLPRVFPFQSHSLIVLCELAEMATESQAATR